MTGRGYIPALRLRALTRFYDPLIERWTAGRRMREAVIDALGLESGMRLLELGCGPGRLAIEIKRRNPDVTIEAVDADPEILARARANAADAGVQIVFREADATALPDLGSFDRIHSTLMFHHLLLPGKRAALIRARQSLQPGGYLVIADFARPDGAVQWLLASVLHPLDGPANTAPHRDGRFERLLLEQFPSTTSAARWKTAFGTVELFICRP